MNSISLVFDSDVQPEDLDILRTARGCLGASAYRNTANLYFRSVDTGSVASVAALVRRRMGSTMAPLALTDDDGFGGVYAPVAIGAAA